MSTDLRLALVSVPNQPGRVRDNLELHVRWIERAAERGAHAVLFPECGLTGYALPSAAALSREGPELDEIAEACRRHGVFAFVGFAEADRDRVFSTCAVVGPRGPLGAVRKINGIPEEANVFGAGTALPVFEVAGRRIGVAICADASTYEVPKILALRGAEIVVCPHANAHPGLRGSAKRWVEWRLSKWRRFMPDLGVDLVGSNLGGSVETEGGATRTFAGGVVALSPEGVVADDDAMCIVRLAPRTNPALPLFECLRPNILYGRTGWAYGRVEEDAPPTATAPQTRDARVAQYHAASALAYHRASRLGDYPIPPVDLRDEPWAIDDTVDGVCTVDASHAMSLREASLADVLNRRRSRRAFAAAPLSSSVLASLLWSAYGRQRASDDPEHRTVPSAGGLYPLRLFVIVERDAGFGVGAFVYVPQRGVLRRYDEAPISSVGWFATDDVDYGAASATLVIVAEIERVAVKYGERGYRYALLEAGHVAQNVVLAAAALDVACVPVGGFDDRATSNALKLDRATHLPVHCLVLGAP